MIRVNEDQISLHHSFFCINTHSPPSFDPLNPAANKEPHLLTKSIICELQDPTPPSHQRQRNMSDVESTNTHITDKMSEHKYVYGVSMSCKGCSGAVERVLGKLDGSSFYLLPRLPLSRNFTHPHPFPSLPLPVITPSLHFLPNPQSSILPLTRHAKINPSLTPHPTGVKSFDVSIPTQTATVITEPTLDYETVLEKIRKTGKKINSGEADGESRSVEPPQVVAE